MSSQERNRKLTAVFVYVCIHTNHYLAHSSDVHQAVSVLDRPELLSVANFARNELHELMASAPELNVTRVIYLDTDTIVARDIAELYSHASALMDARVHASEQHHDEEEGEEQHARRTNGSGRREVVMVAVRSCERRMDYFYNFDAADSIRATMNATDCYINAGVYVMDLDRYRVLGIADTIASLQEAHVRSGAHSGGLWREGTHQPSFILALYNYTATDGIDPRWNVSGLGWNSTKTHRELAQAFILHWTGHRYYRTLTHTLSLFLELKRAPLRILHFHHLHERNHTFSYSITHILTLQAYIPNCCFSLSLSLSFLSLLNYLVLCI